ncbi:hypothetical protein GCM10010872_38350 [Dyella flava]|nr:hypothetical protein GCM10010872_38350 [Dyella flava]
MAAQSDVFAEAATTSPHLSQQTFPDASVSDANRYVGWTPPPPRPKRQTTQPATHDDFAGVPAQSVVDKPAEGLPDLTRLPKPTAGKSAGFEQASAGFWDEPVTSHWMTRRIQQENQLASQLDQDVKERIEAGELSTEAKRIVDNNVHQRSDPEHGLYTVKAGGDNAAEPLNGVVIMTQKPAGYSYVEKKVTDRLDRTGATVLYIPGRDGTLREFASAKQALDWFDEQLRNNADFRHVILAKQAPQNQQRISVAIDKQGSAVFADRMSGDLPQAMVESQINTWKTTALSSAQGAWLSESGLDVSRSDESQELAIWNADNRLIRDRLPARLKNLTLNDADKESLRALAGDIQEQDEIAQNYYGDVPSFDTYAARTIRQQILKDKHVAIDPSRITLTIPTRTYVQLPGITGPSSHTVDGTVRYPLTEVIAQQLLNTAPKEWRIDRAVLSGPGAEKLDTDYVENLQDELELQENYAKKIQQTFAEPTTPDGKEAFDIALSAVKKGNADKMRYDAEIALHAGDLTKRDYKMVMDVVDFPDAHGRPMGSDGKVTHVYGLALDGSNGRHGISMRDVAMFDRDNEPGIVVYTPGAPDGKAFRRYDGRDAFTHDLRQQLASINHDKSDSWSPVAQYWASQFGAHQLREGLPWLKSMAQSGTADSKLGSVRIDGDFFQHQYDYRVRHLLSDADAKAKTDNEVTVENRLDIAKDIYRAGSTIASMFAPGYIVFPLAMSEVASDLFQSYQAYSQGDKQAASDALLSALTGIPGVASSAARGGARAWMPFRGVRRPLVAAPSSKLDLQRPTLPQGNLPVSSVPTGQYKGLYADGANQALYAKLDGEYSRVYVDRQTGAVHVGDPGSLSASSGFFNDPIVQRNALTGDWQVAPRMGLRGGMPWWRRKDKDDFNLDRPITVDAAQKKVVDTWKIEWSSPEEGYTYHGYVFRGDFREPSTIFKEGFQLRTPIKNLGEVNGFKGGFGGGRDALDPDGKGISTSAFYRKDGAGAYFYGESRGGYTYLIDGRGLKGYHLYRNAAIQAQNRRNNPGSVGAELQPWEINYGEDIPGSRVVGAYKEGVFTKNPGYTPKGG